MVKRSWQSTPSCRRVVRSAGIVTDANGDPVAGGRIEVSVSGPSSRSTVAWDGSYVIGPADPGFVHCVVPRLGMAVYAPEWYDDADRCGVGDAGGGRRW